MAQRGLLVLISTALSQSESAVLSGLLAFLDIGNLNFGILFSTECVFSIKQIVKYAQLKSKYKRRIPVKNLEYSKQEE
jgi:hypothetical protein